MLSLTIEKRLKVLFKEIQSRNFPFKSNFMNHICSHSTRLLAATTLRNVLGTRNLAEILSERESISKVMQDALDEATDSWGVKVITLQSFLNL